MYLTYRLQLGCLHCPTIDLEDMDRLRVGGGAQEVPAGREDQGGDADAADSPAELLHPLAILDAKDPDDSAPLGGGGQQGAAGREGQGGEGRIMGPDGHARSQLAGIKDAQLTAGLADGKGQVGVEGEGTQALLIWRNVLDGVQDLHVANVVDVYALRQADDQPLPVHADAQDLRGVEAVADVLLLLKVQHLEAVGLLGGDQHHQRAVEQPLHYPDLLRVVLGEDLLHLVLAGNRVQAQASGTQNGEGAVGKNKL